MVNELECSLVIKFSQRLSTKLINTLLFSLLFSLPVFGKELVLVSSTEASYKPLSSFEVRKIFLGYTIKRNNTPLIAIRNKSNKQSYQIFLQKVIHMSARNYERRLMSKTFRTGIPSVSSIDTLPELTNKLLSNKFILSVMWLKDVEVNNNLKVVQVVWAEEQ